MGRYKLVDRNLRFLPVVLDAQLIAGSFEYALDYLIDDEIDLTNLHQRYRNDETGAPAYDPGVMLKIVLLAYSRGMISSRAIERACRENVLFMALSGDSAPQFTTIAKFVRELAEEVSAIFTQVLLVCDARGLIGRQMFAIDGVKLPWNASKERSGTHAELAHQAQRMERAVSTMLKAHRSGDESGEFIGDDTLEHAQRIERLKDEARGIREFLSTHRERRSDKGSVRKSNVTDNDSAKMATSKGVIQGYTAVAAVDSQAQVIVAAHAHGSGSEQSVLLPMIHNTDTYRSDHTVITADAGYHSEANLRGLCEAQIPALIADGLMRRRDVRFAYQRKYKALPDPLYDKQALHAGQAGPIKQFLPKDFTYEPATNTCVCPAGKHLYSNGNHCITNGRVHHKFSGAQRDCVPCKLRAQCLRYPDRTKVRQVAIFSKQQASPLPYTERMKHAIDSERGRALYGRRIATVEPVFANLRYNKRLDRFTLRTQSKVDTQWKLFCLVHNIEKLTRHGYAR
ncbi:MAG: IS1182 family transposase [Betaproteobacteria bacterium]